MKSHTSKMLNNLDVKTNISEFQRNFIIISIFIEPTRFICKYFYIIKVLEKYIFLKKRTIKSYNKKKQC